MNDQNKKLDDWLQAQIEDAKQREASWGYNHNPNYWFDKGRKEAFMEMRVYLKEMSQ